MRTSLSDRVKVQGSESLVSRVRAFKAVRVRYANSKET
jgi:hypothetical protein